MPFVRSWDFGGNDVRSAGRTGAVGVTSARQAGEIVSL
jgi:hypothetical protein